MVPSQRYPTMALVLLTALFSLSHHTTVGWVVPRQTPQQRVPASRFSVNANDNNNNGIQQQQRSTIHSSSTQLNLHAAVVSPWGGTTPTSMQTLIPRDGDLEDLSALNAPHNADDTAEKDNSVNNDDPATTTIAQLCQHFQATPIDLLRFDSATTIGDGVRGVYLNRAVPQGDILLQLPLEACLRDDAPPKWWMRDNGNNDSDQWATRLAACWTDLYLQQQLSHQTEKGGVEDINTDATTHQLWLSLLPDPDLLRASLPVHWPEEVVSNARSTSLEVAADSSYFVRAEAVQTLVEAVQTASPFYGKEEESNDDDDLTSLAHRALDIVQTRSCRLQSQEADSSERSCRVLAPIFDFINHGTQSVSNANEQDDSNANAVFGREGDFLVVRALRNLQADEEVLIDYGDSARPAWKCLLSYGFVPRYDKGSAEDNLAEVYMMGQRFEVTAETIPLEMVVAATASAIEINQKEEETAEVDTPVLVQDVTLTPDVAERIAERCEEVAFFLLLEPELDPYHDFDETDISLASLAPTEVLSHSLAASLRWSQHKVLMSCAQGLRRFATEEQL